MTLMQELVMRPNNVDTAVVYDIMSHDVAVTEQMKLCDIRKTQCRRIWGNMVIFLLIFVLLNNLWL